MAKSISEACSSLPSRAAIAIFLAATTLLAGVLDAVSTELALATGLAFEANPFVRAIQDEIGSFWLVPKLITHVTLAYVIVKFPTNFTFGIMGMLAMVTLGAALSNFEIYFDIILAQA